MKETSQFQQASNRSLTPAEQQISGEAWDSLLPDPLRNRTLETLSLLAERLCDPAQVARIAEQAKTQSDEFFWNGASLASSFSSLALLYLFLWRSLSDQRWEELAHKYLRLAAQTTRELPLLHPGMFSGSTGFALILALFCQAEPGYQPLFERVCADVLAQVIEHPSLKRGPSSSVPNTDYEAISGAAGMLAFLISLPSLTDMAQDTIQKLLAYLVWLSEADEQGHVHWFVLPEYMPTIDFYRQFYPHGYFNLGLSHGIPGPLAALSLAWMAGYRVSGQREAIERLSRWLIGRQVPDQWGINWPTGIPLEYSASLELWQRLPPARAAWCYGAPGITSTLWLAGRAIADTPLQHIAITGLEAVLSRPVEERGIGSPTLCHGIGGLLAICLRFAHRSASQLISAHLPVLTTQILDACSPDFPLGVRDEARPGEFVDDPGFLTGAAGVALVLLAGATSTAPQWDRALLLS